MPNDVFQKIIGSNPIINGSTVVSPNTFADYQGMNPDVTASNSGVVIPVLDPRFDDVSYYRNNSKTVQGYYGLLSNFYFVGETPTETIIDEDNVSTWVDANLTIDPLGLFDYRLDDMKSASSIGHTGAGTSGDPIIFNLEGLTIHAHANFRASMSFEPEVDESQVETRLLFNRHTGTTPSGDFPIEEVSLTMTQGAGIEYASEPMLSFFVGDTIDTNGPGDAGKCRFQIKASSEGILRMRALTWYIQA